MRKIFFLVLYIFCIQSYASEAKKIRPAENIQVLLEKDVPGALLEVKGPYYILNPEDGARISSGLLGKRFLVHAQQNGIKWDSLFNGIHQIYVVPRSPETSILVNGIQYEGAIAIFQIDNKINVVNDVNIESYIKSVLTPQFPYPLENEVMAAVAILARTEAYHQANLGANSFWHVHANQVGYQGSALNLENSIINRCIDSTKNLILVHPHKGKNVPFAAQWTEHSAGKTASYNAIFRHDGQGPTQSIEAIHAQLDREDTKWSFSVSKDELAKLFHFNTIDQIQLFVDSDSNKTYAARLMGDKESKDLNFFELQSYLGKNRLKSTDFTFSFKDGQAIFEGYGIGHGVGLCLHSATAMAQNGENAVQILAKFFPQTYIMNLSAIPKGEKNVVDNFNKKELFTK